MSGHLFVQKVFKSDALRFAQKPVIPYEQKRDAEEISILILINESLKTRDNVEGIATIDLAIAYDWIYDEDFVFLLKQEAERVGLSVLVINNENLAKVVAALENRQIAISAFIDRASDTSPIFSCLQGLLYAAGAFILDSISKRIWASDKATMHLEFITHGLNTPYTIILEPFDSKEDILLSSEDLACLGRPFIIKPANTTGGGIGVVEGAESLHDVLTARQEFKKDKYLLQANVQPMERYGKRFWFRGIYACGLVTCLWWNDKTHLYTKILPQEIEQHNLTPLFQITEEIARICKLFFFSTEIAMTEGGKFIVVDYVNESCDMRLQSRHADGVPDDIVTLIVMQMIRFLGQQLDK